MYSLNKLYYYSITSYVQQHVVLMWLQISTSLNSLRAYSITKFVTASIGKICLLYNYLQLLPLWTAEFIQSLTSLQQVLEKYVYYPQL